jgi:F0F1-type ATP synthase assembly protein I
MRGWRDLQLVGRLGMLLTVPVILVSGPLLGAVFGGWMDRRWHTEPWALVACSALGAIGSGVEVYRILRWIARLGRNKTGNSSR